MKVGDRFQVCIGWKSFNPDQVVEYIRDSIDCPADREPKHCVYVSLVGRKDCGGDIPRQFLQPVVNVEDKQDRIIELLEVLVAQGKKNPPTVNLEKVTGYLSPEMLDHHTGKLK